MSSPSILYFRMSKRNEYPLKLRINGRQLSRVIIDQHYQLNHPEINDDLILKLVGELEDGHFLIEEKKGEFEYFTVGPVIYKERPYKLILLLCVCDDFLGVINAFRIKVRRK